MSNNLNSDENFNANDIPNSNLNLNSYTHDISHLFANETEELRLINALISHDIEINEFDECCNDIDKLIESSYKNNSTDIEDMSDLIMGINLIIEKMWIDHTHAIKFYELLLLRKKAKKLAHKKFREGYDWYHREEIKLGTIKPIIKYQDEKPREFWNVESCAFQYGELVDYVWKPSVEKLKKNYQYFNFDEQ